MCLSTDQVLVLVRKRKREENRRRDEYNMYEDKIKKEAETDHSHSTCLQIYKYNPK